MCRRELEYVPSVDDGANAGQLQAVPAAQPTSNDDIAELVMLSDSERHARSNRHAALVEALTKLEVANKAKSSIEIEVAEIGRAIEKLMQLKIAEQTRHCLQKELQVQQGFIRDASEVSSTLVSLVQDCSEELKILMQQQCRQPSTRASLAMTLVQAQRMCAQS